MLLEIPARIEAERIYLRSYEAGDGQWYYRENKKNADGKLSGTLYFGLLKREFEALDKNQ